MVILTALQRESTLWLSRKLHLRHPLAPAQEEKHPRLLPSTVHSRKTAEQTDSTKRALVSYRSLHVKKSLLVLEQVTTEIILGGPWHFQHQPEICWKEILKWGGNCFPSCFSTLGALQPKTYTPIDLCATAIESPQEKLSVKIP